MPAKATLPYAGINVPTLIFSLAGFDLIIIGRSWVFTEE
jgi:hypothetical protein